MTTTMIEIEEKKCAQIFLNIFVSSFERSIQKFSFFCSSFQSILCTHMWCDSVHTLYYSPGWSVYTSVTRSVLCGPFCVQRVVLSPHFTSTEFECTLLLLSILYRLRFRVDEKRETRAATEKSARARGKERLSERRRLVSRELTKTRTYKPRV